MSFIAIVGADVSRLNQELMAYAASHLPAILIDCANAADPHRFYPQLDLPTMQRIYVFELELLHKFRDVLKRVPFYARKLQTRIIVVTVSDRLINYHNDRENRDITIHAWQLMRKIGNDHDIVVGVFPASEQFALAQKYCQELKRGGHDI